MNNKFVSEDFAREEPSRLNDPDLEEDDLWQIITAFFETHGLIQHQLASFDEFIETGIRTIFDNHRILSVEVVAESEIKELEKILGKEKSKSLGELLKTADNEEKLQTLLEKLKTKTTDAFVEKHPCLYVKNGSIMKKYTVEFGEIFLEDPIHVEVSSVSKKITPFECCSRKIAYQSQLLADIETTDFNGHVNIYQRVHIGNIPVMVGSRLCNLRSVKNNKEEMARLREDFYDPGGYFITNKGSRKVIVSQERAAANQICVFKINKKGPKYTFYAEVRSCAPRSSHSTTAQVGMLKSGRIGVTVPYIDSSVIPLGLMFRALGIDGDAKEMVGYILPDLTDREAVQLLVSSFEYSLECKETESALKYIGKKGKKFTGIKKDEEEIENKETTINAVSYAKHLLHSEFLPHLGVGPEFVVKKRFYLGYMVQRLLWVILGRIPTQDRDHFANKRITTAGEMFSQQFVSALRRFKNEISSGIQKDSQKNSAIKITSKIGPKIITNALSTALTDNSGLRGKGQGASQNFDHFNLSDTLSSLRKLITPINQDSGGKIDLPRKLHNSQWGVCCIAETPEGKKVGLAKQLALSCLITVGSPPDSILEILKSMRIIAFEEIVDRKGNLLAWDKVFVNGDYIGVTQFPNEVIGGLRLLRRRGQLNPETSLSYDSKQREVSILTEHGRAIRPLLIVEKGRPLLRKSHILKIQSGEWDEPSVWVNLISKGYIEMVDKTEEENLLVAYSPQDLDGMDVIKRLKYTHCELHPCLIYGAGASTIPFPHCNQSPRNAYQSSMGKQAIGIPGTNYQFETHGKFYALHYPEIPLVYSRTAKTIGFHDLPSSQNVIVAVCPFHGYNQEDSIIMNKDSIERGLLNITAFLCFEATVNRRHNQEKFEIPKEHETNRFRGNTSKLIQETVKNIGSEKIFCFAPEGTKVEHGDVIIGKTMVENDIASIHRKKKTDVSVIYNHVWPGTVHSIQRGVDGNGYDYIRVVVAQVRNPVCGDKFSATHGQKGTIGKIYRSYELPFIAHSGVAPDVLLNPLAFPSRMTIGLMIEMLTGKKIAAGSRLHTTPVRKVLCLDSTSKKDRVLTEDPWEKSISGKYSEKKSYGDATPFNPNFSLREVCEELKSLGFNEFGDEQMINGVTGEPMSCPIFVGICAYQRLRHMVIDKVHARSRGGRNILTRQPTEGRQRAGGLKFGLMERDCVLGQGCPIMTKDRLMDQSDAYTAWVCKYCGLLGTVVKKEETNLRESGKHSIDMFCRVCETKKLVKVKLPYATKLVAQELAGMGIVLRMMTD